MLAFPPPPPRADASDLPHAGSVVKTGEIWAGVPAKLLRSISADEKGFVAASADNYARIATEHRWVNAVSLGSRTMF